jgi:predicted secreted acid phosphatase
MDKIIIILIVSLAFVFIVSVLLMPTKNKNVYDMAYEIGKNYINSFPLETVKNPSVMFDIDDTLLYNGEMGELSPIKPIIKLLNLCRSKALDIIIITARDSLYTEQTIEDLKKYNINYDILYLKKSKENYSTFKSDAKKRYTMEGYTFIMSVGDNDIDVIGPYSGYGIKLPNNYDSRLYEIRLDGNIYII